MMRPQKKGRSKRGIGACGAPGCRETKAPGHHLCSDHLEKITEVKNTLAEEAAARSIYLRRSDNQNRTVDTANGRKRAPRRPTCCWLGCFENRIPGTNYCEFHADLADTEEDWNEYGAGS